MDRQRQHSLGDRGELERVRRQMYEIALPLHQTIYPAAPDRRDVNTVVGAVLNKIAERHSTPDAYFADAARDLAEARDFVFMMVQDEERHVSLAQVSKLDGRIVGQIAMQGDKEPSYQVDDIGNLLFYRPTPSTITTYRFSPQRLQVARP